MEPRTLQAFLRVLYTVNNNPQYILAKSSFQAPVILCSEPVTQTATNESTYARAPLKLCLAAVCDSSPELLQDPTRDFSLYVLDPLEAQPPPTNLTHNTHDASLPRGVAVALGLMSRALESNDPTDVYVTGTVIPNALPALEVIFALRETKCVQKLRPHPSMGSTPGAGSSQAINPHHPSQAMNWLYPHIQRDQHEQRTLARSADFPELYIGPPRRAPGRPEGSTARSKGKLQAGISSHSGKGTETQSESRQVVRRKSKQKTRSKPPRAPPTYSPFICEPLMRNTVAELPAASVSGAPAFYQQSYPFIQNQVQSQAQIYPHNQPYAHPMQDPLLGLLSAISSTSSSNTRGNTTSVPQTVLLSALQGLLIANPHLLQLAEADVGTSATARKQTENKPVHGESKVEDEDGDADSDIVILDSSTVDATAFRKPSYRKQAASDTDASPPATSQDSPMPSIQDIVPSPPLRTGTTETTAPTSKHVSWQRAENITPSQVSDVPETPTLPRVRKRKLNEYIQDQLHSSSPTSPPSPSPSAARASTSKRAFAAKPVWSSPTRGAKSVLLSSARLPSMLGSMRCMASLSSRLRVSSFDASTIRESAAMATNKNGDLSTTLLSSPSKSKTNHTTSSSSVASDATSLKRKLNLNLNEVMEEQETRKNAKIRKHQSLGRKLEEGVNASQAGPSRSSQLASTPRHAQSSPPRPLFRSNSVASSLSVPTWQSGLASGAGISNPPAIIPAGTPTSTATTTKNPLKNFVMPAWARTNTAMLPRLSDEALARQQAEQKAKKAQVSLKRKEVAKAKRKRLRDADRPSKESSDEGDEAITNDSKPRPPHASSIVRNASLATPPQPLLPVFASDAVAPIPPSPPQTHRQLPPTPSTPPRKPVSPSALHRTPNKSGSCSLFTPSGQDPGSLFTPSTPSVTRSLNRPAFTPRSPTVLHCSGAVISPRRSIPHTPKRNGTSQTPKNLRNGRNAPVGSPGLTVRTPQTGMGMRAFLLPPPSPMCSKVRGSETPEKQSEHQGEGLNEDALVCGRDAFLGTEMSTSPAQLSQAQPTSDDEQATNEPRDFASSPLPPSSPVPASPFSSPEKLHDSDVNTPPTNNLIVPESDVLLPSANDSNRPKEVMDTNWLSNNARASSWLTDSEASAWFTETDAWLTDTEGGPLLTDSDGVWLSDSDAVFGDMSSLPPSSASNWFSDDGDIDTDGESRVGAMACPDDAFDTAAFERAFAALVEHGERNVAGMNERVDGTTDAVDAKSVGSEFWKSIQPLLDENVVDDAGIGESVDENKVAQDLQALLNGIVGS